MAALSAKELVFNSVFKPQQSPTQPSTGSNQVSDRAWQTVTQTLILPPISKDSDLLQAFKANPSPDRRFDEALKILQQSGAADIILWYTNHVRRHYFNQVFPIIQSIRAVQNPDIWLQQCIGILEGAHRLYFQGLALLVKRRDDIAVKNFRLNLRTVVSNSISDRTPIKIVVKKHVSAILSPNRSTPESDFLRLVRSLASIGLGGEQFQIIFAEVMDEAMRERVYRGCGEIWDDSTSESASRILPRAVQHVLTSRCTTDLCEWIENRYAKLAIQVLEILDNVKVNGVNVSWSQLEKWKEMSIGHLAMLRTNELFDIVAQWPNSAGGLNDLRTAINTPQRRLQLTDVFTSKLNDQLLHPGASTLQILQTYIAMIRSFHVLDHSGVLLTRVAFSLQLYLCSREDTVRIIIVGLLSEIVDDQGNAVKPGGEILVELALLLNENSNLRRTEDEGLDWHDLDWVPDPVDAGPGYKRSKSADIIGTLIQVLGSQDIFIKEFQNIIGESLLKEDGGFEREIKVLDLLKARFGEAPLQSCEVMLKDIQDSVRVDAVIRRNQKLDPSDQELEAAGLEANPEGLLKPSLHAKILSRLFWPQLHDETYKLPDAIIELQKRYEQGFEALKAARKLTWLHALGQVTVELQLADRDLVEEVHTWQATIIWAFESNEPHSQANEVSIQRSVEQLVELLEMDEALVRSGLKFWANKLVLQEVSKDTYAVLEELNQEDRARSNAQAAAGPPKSADEDKSLTLNEGITTEKMQIYWQFIQGMLTNSSSQMPLQQIAMMLKMLIADGFPYSNEELQEFLSSKVETGELELVGGKYRLKK